MTSQTIFASGLENGEIKVWDFDLDFLLYTLRGHTGAVLNLEYLSNNFLASGDENGYIFIWNLLKRTKVTELIHDRYVRSIILIDSTTFASAASNSIKLWWIDSFTNRLSIQNAHSSDIIGLRYFSNRLFSISTDGILKSWENFNYKFQINVNCEVLSFELISNGNLVCGCTNNLIKIYSAGLDSFSFIRSIGQISDVSSLSVLESEFLVSGDTDGRLNIWNPNTGLKLMSFFGHNSKVNTLENIKNKTFLSGSDAGNIKAWNMDNGNKLRQYFVDSTVCFLKYFDRKFNLISTLKNSHIIFKLI
ncbi:unnamed protein product [Brachionus calyciflorus]|uniref:Uncharacterized protein n=1 Tax=Brachionus calyciflorus TaxID=104777 RepID=A0A814LDH9_9BILA|nr:unnamed protein product [Brachionus calyciflorus]